MTEISFISCGCILEINKKGKLMADNCCNLHKNVRSRILIKTVRLHQRGFEKEFGNRPSLNQVGIIVQDCDIERAKIARSDFTGKPRNRSMFRNIKLSLLGQKP